MRPTDPDTHTHLDANGTPYDHTHDCTADHIACDPDTYFAPYCHVIDPDRDTNADVTITTATTEGGRWYLLPDAARDVLR